MERVEFTHISYDELMLQNNTFRYTYDKLEKKKATSRSRGSSSVKTTTSLYIIFSPNNIIQFKNPESTGDKQNTPEGALLEEIGKNFTYIVGIQ